MKDKIIIIDYGMGNLFSVKKKFYRLGINAEVTSRSADISSADKIVIPGVGHFGKAVENLKRLNLWNPLNEAAIMKRKAIMGICLGMQLMAKHSEEGNSEGFGWFDATVVRFKISDTLKYKIPHIGWNNLQLNKSSMLFEGIPAQSEFYFVHAYHMVSQNPSEVLSYSNYEYDFISSVEKDNIFGLQFHPEKSHDSGERLLLNFARL